MSLNFSTFARHECDINKGLLPKETCKEGNEIGLMIVPAKTVLSHVGVRRGMLTGMSFTCSTTEETIQIRVVPNAIWIRVSVCRRSIVGGRRRLRTRRGSHYYPVPIGIKFEQNEMILECEWKRCMSHAH